MKKINVLFVCLGNICRSPTAEAVFNACVKTSKLESSFFVDSAGTNGLHDGEAADRRSAAHAKKRNIHLTSISRKVCSSDFKKFDYILAMDDSNVENLKKITTHAEDHVKIKKITDFALNYNDQFVPDPYYGGDEGFELVLDLLADCCSNLLKNICEEHKIKQS